MCTVAIISVHANFFLPGIVTCKVVVDPLCLSLALLCSKLRRSMNENTKAIEKDLHDIMKEINAKCAPKPATTSANRKHSRAISNGTDKSQNVRISALHYYPPHRTRCMHKLNLSRN